MSASEVTSSFAKRVCQVIAVKKEHLDEYKAIHANVWETVLNGLRRSHIVDYSIHFMPAPPFAMAQYSKDANVGGLLIANFKYIGRDFEGDMKRAAEDDETRKWWKITDPMQHSFIEGAKSSEEGPWWYECEEVFRFENVWYNQFVVEVYGDRNMKGSEFIPGEE